MTMTKALAAALAFTLAVAACDHGPSVGGTPTPPASGALPLDNRADLACDGRVLRPGEQCP